MPTKDRIPRTPIAKLYKAFYRSQMSKKIKNKRDFVKHDIYNKFFEFNTA